MLSEAERHFKNLKIFVIHVSKGYEERREHIDKHLPELGINNYEYILDGDISSLNDEIISKYYSGYMLTDKPAMSCMYKHLLAYKEIVDRGLSQALILEDDVLMEASAKKDISLVLEEIYQRQLSNYLITCEQSNLSVPVYYKLKNKGQRLIQANKTKRCASYIISNTTAKKILSYFDDKTSVDPIDIFQNEKVHEVGFNIFWDVKPFVKQGSKYGVFESELSKRKMRKNLLASVEFGCRDLYQKTIASNFSAKRYKSFSDVKKYQ